MKNKHLLLLKEEVYYEKEYLQKIVKNYEEVLYK